MPNRLKTKLSRRDFLKLAGATTITVPTLLGLNLLYNSRGELPGASDLLENTRSIYSDVLGNQPILVLHNDFSENPFGAYLGEILLTEGINSFDLAKLSDLDFDHLAHYDTVLLTDGMLNQIQADKISRYVFGGGNLIAMHPDSKLAPILGLKDQMKINDQEYIVIESSHEFGLGIVPASMQYHSDANDYLLDGAQVVAWLCDKNGERKDYPAVSINKYGDGWACAWAYDLTKSIALTRQGNPEWANQERDGFWGIRSSDMFYGWIDLDKIETPQADEQQRLLTNVLNFFSQGKHPLPRLWYFPGHAKSMLIATSDAHQNPGWAIENVISHAEKYGGHISIYSLPPIYDIPHRAAQKVRWWLEDMSLMDKAYFPSPSRVADWRARGHEFGIHPLVEDGFKQGWWENWERFTGVGYGTVSPTTRVHRILWDGWVESAKLQAEYGFRMNLDYYHVGDAFRKENGEWVYGHFTGSGLPMKFVDENGRILNIYQQLTQLADDHLLNLHWGGSVKLAAEKAVDVSKTLLAQSVNGGYAAIGAIFHTDPFAVGEPWATEEGKWMDGTLEYAASNGIPIWSSEMWLNFVESRHDATIEEIFWSAAEKQLNFTVTNSSLQMSSISVLIPLEHSNLWLSGLELNGTTVKFLEHFIGAQKYAWFEIDPGQNSVKAFYI